MKNYTRLLCIIVSGLTCFQIFSTIRVYVSNHSLFSMLEIIKDHGYLIVPNQIIMDTLPNLKPAICGGLFFTLTIGAFVTLASVLSAYLYSVTKHTAGLTIITLSSFFFISLFFTINLDGFLFRETLSILSTIILVHVMFLWLFRNAELPSPLKICLHAVPLLILGGLLILSSGGEKNSLFSDFRDNFLFSNPVGMTINTFYYTYTLYPARVFKSHRQQVLKTCHIDPGKTDEGTVDQVKQTLLGWDYLPVNDNTKTDILVSLDTSALSINYQGSSVTKTSVSDFLKNPSDSFKDFSEKTDTYRQYRKLTGISLKSGLPLTMYILIHFFITSLCSLLRKQSIAPVAASACTLTIGVAGFIILSLASPESIEKETLSQMLSSETLRDRVSALKYINNNSLNISRYPEHRPLITNGSVLERYWVARASGNSRNPENTSDVIRLLDDPHPNVVCQAFYALGKKGNRNLIPDILKRIPMSDNWYVQWYAYRALKRLRWKQNEFKQTSS